MNSLFIYNPAAGQMSVEKDVVRCLESLEQRGWCVQLVTTDRAGQATQVAHQAAEAGHDLVVAIGGDGTVGEVANGLVGTETILGVIPAGTTNVWALQMNIPCLPPWHPRKVVDRMLADLEELGWHRPAGIPSWLSGAFLVLLNSEVRAVDMGRIGDRYFLLWGGVGLDARVTESVSLEDKRRFGFLAFIAATLSVAVDYTGARTTLATRDREIEDEMLLVVAANTRLYGGILEMAPTALLDDGLLDICVFKGDRFGMTLRHVTALLAGRHVGEPNFDYLKVDYLRVNASPPQPVHADDEVCGGTPVDITVAPRSLRVAVPPSSDRGLFSHPRIGWLKDME